MSGDRGHWDVSANGDWIEIRSMSNYGDDPAYLTKDEAAQFANAILEAAGVRVPYDMTPLVPESAAGQMLAEHNDSERFKGLLDRSSFGTPGAKAAMATVPQSKVDEVLRRARLPRAVPDADEPHTPAAAECVCEEPCRYCHCKETP